MDVSRDYTPFADEEADTGEVHGFTQGHTRGKMIATHYSNSYNSRHRGVALVFLHIITSSNEHIMLELAQSWTEHGTCWTGPKVGDSPDFFRDVSNDLTLIVNLKAALRGIKLPAYATLIG
ncbi:hypothetical protein DUI87_05764 [Hirundo rustica rustica]|uniref:Uncharacterized protein n=1 Tax=Hirundo rustica rustica TaxID=333673 RepID=A0A3M0LDI1_HIRRU|nr:hypothetical protein DUI87_05764 [Hirundo rustica rustica]